MNLLHCVTANIEMRQEERHGHRFKETPEDLLSISKERGGGKRNPKRCTGVGKEGKAVLASKQMDIGP